MPFLKEEPSLSDRTYAAIQAALLVGDILQKGFGSICSLHYKPGKHNLVTNCDYASEKAILSFIHERFPEDTFLSEEKGREGSPSEKTIDWVIDPLDGTVNFAHSIPHFCISIAGMRGGQSLFGVVYQPMVHELFVAQRGHGAYLNGKKIEVSAVKQVDNSMLSTGFPYNVEEDPDKCVERFTRIIRLGIPVRRLGAAALDLAYVASGRLDGYWETGLGPWDCAAGSLLVEEAGGKVTDWKGNPLVLQEKNSIFASNEKIHEEMAALLNLG